jgi:hypothetical protein
MARYQLESIGMTDAQLTIHAAAIVASLTPEQIEYSIAEERGEFRGFAALHDLMDANELILSRVPEDDGEWLKSCNRIGFRVTAMLLA